jgi:hypothetical protein
MFGLSGEDYPQLEDIAKFHRVPLKAVWELFNDSESDPEES